ncbi:MAG TPA: histidine kinase N-terminal 7TM domain-containing protein [Thermoanaerobaculia bacterium]|nr:histidine kinase N-terminal 7TM domain-containing protein [Thermoanaerobaculia bacterium]
MRVELTLYGLLSVAAAWVASLVAILVWPRRDRAPGARALFWLMLAAAEWSLGAAGELTAESLGAKLLWSKVEYVGTLAAPALFLVFAIQFEGSIRSLRGGRAARLFLFPVLTLILAWTNELHGLVWSGFRVSPAGPKLLIYERGPWFWIGVVGYAYLCMLLGTVLLLRAARRLSRGSRGQAVALLVAVAIPWLANASYIFGFFPIPGLDPTPLSMAAVGVLCALAIFRFGLLDPRPAARERVIERMPGGVVLLDADDRVLEINPAASRLLGSNAEGVGRPFEEVFAAWPKLIEAAARRDEGSLELTVPMSSGERTLVADFGSSVEDAGRPGRVLVLHDVSERKRVEEELRRANRLLVDQLEEIGKLESSLRDQAMRDALTGLFNRRYLDETLPREVARAERSGEPLSLVLLDLDHFKQLNDAHGHAAGDEVLRELGLLLRSRTRRSDITCRYGGEEFLIAMPATDPSAAVERAEELRSAFEKRTFGGAAAGLSSTLSAGVAALPGHAATLDGLLASSDLALYAAKAAGRNRVVLAS